MSFGFGVSISFAVAKIAKSVQKFCKVGPAKYTEICRETKSLRFTLENLSEDAASPNSLLNRYGLKRMELGEIISKCKATMNELQTMVDKRSRLGSDGRGKVTRIWDAYQMDSSDLNCYCGKLTFYTLSIGVFLLSLHGPTMGRIGSILRADSARRHDSSSEKFHSRVYDLNILNILAN